MRARARGPSHAVPPPLFHASSAAGILPPGVRVHVRPRAGVRRVRVHLRRRPRAGARPDGPHARHRALQEGSVGTGAGAGAITSEVVTLFCGWPRVQEHSLVLNLFVYLEHIGDTNWCAAPTNTYTHTTHTHTQRRNTHTHTRACDECVCDGACSSFRSCLCVLVLPCRSCGVVRRSAQCLTAVCVLPAGLRSWWRRLRLLCCCGASSSSPRSVSRAAMGWCDLV